MADISYVLEVLLEARNNAAGEIAAFKQQIRDAKAEAQADKGVDDLGDSMDDLADSTDRATKARREHTREHQRAKQPTQDTTRATSDSAESLDEEAEAARGATAALDDHSKKHAALQKQVERTTADFEDFKRSADDLDQSARSRGFSQYARDFENLSNQTRKLKGDFQSLSDLADEASKSGGFASSFNRDEEAARNLSSRIGELEATHARWVSSVDRSGQSYTKQIPVIQAFAREYENLAKSAGAGSAEFDRLTQRATEFRSVARDFSQGSSVQGVVGDFLKFDDAVRAGSVAWKEAAPQYRQFAKDLDSLGRSFATGSEEATRFARLAAAARNNATGGASIGRIFGDITSGNAIQGLQDLGSKLDGVGVKVVSLSAELRGLRLIGLVGFAQEFDSAIVGLVGSLFSLGSSAVQAGAALGGAFVAGMGQAIPVVTILFGAVDRIKAVFTAAQAATALQQQQYADPTQQQQTQIQNAEQLTTAQEALTNSYTTLYDAQERVYDAQIALTQARIDAIRNITDLTLAEHDAQLQAEGSSLALQASKQQLQQSQMTGGILGTEQSVLGVQEAQLSRRRALIAVPRAEADLRRARSYGVENAPAVRSAREGVTESHLAVTQAREAEQQARVQAELAAMAKKARTGSETQAQINLGYLKSQLSPAETVLYDAIVGIEKQLRSPNSPLRKISDDIVEPFANGVERVQKLLSSPTALAALDPLAEGMKKGLTKVIDAITGKRAQGTFATLAGDAAANTAPVSDIAVHLLHLFGDVAKAASPVLHDILERFNAELGKMDTIAEQDKLAGFFKRAGQSAHDIDQFLHALAHLLGALGHDAAPSGNKLFENMTTALDKMTTWVRSNGPEVRSFFDQFRQAVELVGHILGTIGREMVEVFSLNSLNAFTQLIDETVLPGLRTVLNILGDIVKGFLTVINFMGRPGRDFLGIAGIGIAAGLVVGKLAPLLGVFRQMHRFATGIGAAISAISSGKNPFSAFSSSMSSSSETQKLAAGAMGDAAELQNKASLAMQAAGGDMLAAAKLMGPAADEQSAAAGVQKDAGLAQDTAAGEEVTAGGEELSAASGRTVSGLGGGFSGATVAPVAPEAEGLSAEEAAGAGGAAGLGLSAGLATILAPAVAVYLARNWINKVTGGGLAGTQPGEDGTPLAPTAGGPASQLPAYQSFVATASQKLSEFSKSDNVKGLRLLANEADKLGNAFPNAKKKLDQFATTINNALSAQAAQQIKSTYFDKMITAAHDWAVTFSGVNVTSGNVIQQTKQQLAQNLQAINENLGSGTQQGAAAMVTSIAGAYETVLENTTSLQRGVGRGIDGIGKQLNAALTALGVKDVGTVSSLIRAGNMSGANLVASGTISAGGYISPHATGGYISARPGGQIIQAGEGGHDEVVLTTDPSQAGRQRQLLGQYLSNSPHLAAGGKIGSLMQMFTRTYPRFIGIGGAQGQTRFTAEEIGALAQDVGLPALAFEQITEGESAWYPGIQQPDPGNGMIGYGLAQITPHAWGPGAATNYFASLGGISAMFEPLKNFQMAKFLYDQAHGLSPWYGTKYLTAAGRASVTPGTFSTAPSTPISSLPGVVADSMSAGIAAPRIEGSGPMSRLAQRSLNMVASAANSLLSTIGGASAGGASIASKVSSLATGGGGQLPAGLLTPSDVWNPLHKAIAAWIVPILKWASAHGWSGSVTSGYRSFAEQQYLYAHRGTMGISPIVALPGTSNHEKINYPGGAVDADGASDAQLIAILRGYTGGQHLVGGNLGPEDPYHFSATGFAIGGLIRRHLRRKLLRFAQGGRAPWGGAPVPIIAHEDERINNPAQWGEISRLAGTTPQGLDHHLGYDTGSPRQSFASGGVVASDYASLAGLNSTTPSVIGAITNVDITTLGTVQRVFKLIQQGFATLTKFATQGTFASAEKAFETFEASLSDPNQTFDTLISAFQTVQTLTADVGTKAEFFVKRATDALAKSAGQSGTAGVRAVISPAQEDARQVQALVRQRQYLRTLQSGVSDAQKKVRERISATSAQPDSAARTTALTNLKAAYNNLRTQQQTLFDDMTQNIQTTFQTQQQALQDRLTAVTNAYDTRSGVLQTRQAQLQGLGRYGSTAQTVDKQIAEAATKQVARMKPLVEKALAMGDTATAQSLRQSIQQLNQTINSAVVQKMQDAITNVTNAYGVTSGALQTAQSAAQTLGQFGQAQTIDQVIAKAAQTQINKLQPLLTKAMETHNTGAVQSITEQIQQLQQTINQAASQKIQDAVSEITQAVGVTQAQQQSQQSQLQSLGQYQNLPSVDQLIVQQTQYEIASLQKVLQTAGNDPAQQAAIETQIAQLQQTVTQATVQIIQDSIQGIQQQASTSQAQADYLGVLAQVAQSRGQFGQAGMLTGQQLQLNISSEQTQVGQYQGLLAQARAAGDQGDVATLTQQIDQLNGQIAQNVQALEDNTAQVIDNTSQYIQARGQFSTGVFSGLAQIFTTIGQTTGFTDVKSLAGIYGASNQSLQGTQAGLTGQLQQLSGINLQGLSGASLAAAIMGINIPGIEAGHDTQWTSTFENLINSIVSNDEAIQQNTQQLATLNGQLLQPQSFNTTAFSSFRQSIFTGMGGLLPQYSNLLPTGSQPITPTFQSGTPGATGPAVVIENLNLTNPVGTVDTQLLGEQLAYELGSVVK